MNTRHLWAAAALLVPAMAARAAELEKRTFAGEGGKTLPYRLLKPDGYDKEQKYPLVVFLHGAGERGDDNDKQLVHGVPEFAKDENRSKYPCFLIAPQCPDGKSWNLGDAARDAGKLALRTRRRACRRSSASTPSGSTSPACRWAASEPGTSIAGHPTCSRPAVPICGGGDEKQAEKIAKLPIWCFHGDKDTAVKVDLSRNMIAAIKKAGGEPKYTEYPGVGHNSWVQAYKDPEMFKWLFSQKRD